MASSIRTTVHESLPYIDTDPTPSERSAAEALISAEAELSSPRAPTSYPAPTFTPLFQAELSRISSQQPLNAIDLTRYEAQDAPSPTCQTPSHLTPLISRAYTTHTYLQSRQTHLQLLDAYGKNAWLVGNWQTEADLAVLERELAAAKREIDVVNIQRRRLQDEVGEELKGLEEAWRKGVGRVLETEVATETLRHQVLAKQRGGG
ncbi:Pre-mRNA-splicing factor SPF27 [Xylaria bambusicola]|uniref:Pre-mRNA-splicing factor SPF27 n=1 Tax=Xylaria bambusicola TaxID=326684 RepID=UPI002007BDB4|nr:Pre-mRNA-splicing factor SPF27 [Xylaria bambusicola]KAI0505935.1 Pre-mRNA-splicing factor SPF27 [Xylaria bambusicola]